jgi:hypothetical protein
VLHATRNLAGTRIKHNKTTILEYGNYADNLFHILKTPKNRDISITLKRQTRDKQEGI